MRITARKWERDWEGEYAWCDPIGESMKPLFEPLQEHAEYRRET